MIAHTVKNIEGDKVSLCLEIPISEIKPFLSVFSSMFDLAKSATRKVEIATIQTRLESSNEKNNAYYQSYKKAVNDKFDYFFLINHDARESIKLTNKAVKVAYPNACYDSVKKILVQSGSLKKKSFNLPK